ncbi:NLR family CARD domain-containing protein 3-like [Ornithodoros turicata]|uniref:NLR family CARD domain-containing protein 3-like n=1 Tax=Ornithodoros turicata TaxID=34597 RepID=UPI0031397BA3
MSGMCLQGPVVDTLSGLSALPLQHLGHMEERRENVKKALRLQGIDFEEQCTSSTDTDCWILHNLTPWNKILYFANIELKEHKPGKLCLWEVNNKKTANCYDSGPLLSAAFVAYWLVKKHSCVDFFKPSSLVVHLSSSAFKNALASNANLCHLDYSWSGLWPPVEHCVSEGVRLLKNVESLVLCDVKIKHEGAVLVAEMLEDNRQIKKVNFTRNSLTYRGSKRILRALRGCLMLTELVFDSNNIGKKAMKYLGQLVAKSQLLETVALNFSITSENNGIESLASALKINTSVKEIIFDSCISCVEAIADALIENRSVRCAKFVKGGVSDENCSKLSRMLQQNSTLEELHLSSNQIGDYGASFLATGLLGNKTLRKLFLNENRIGYRGMGRLIEALATNESLQFLDITSYSMEDDDSSTLSQALISSRAYGRVRLDWQDVDISQLAKVLAAGSQIEDLELDCSRVSEGKMLEVLSSLCVNAWVKNLHLKGQLSLPVAECIAEVLYTNTSIKSLDVRFWTQQRGFLSLLRALECNRTITKCSINIEEYTTKIRPAMGSVLRKNTAITNLVICGLRERDFRNISRALRYNYTITKLDFGCLAKPNKDVSDIRGLLQRNQSLLNVAARFVISPSVHKERAWAFEKLAHCDSLTEHLVSITSKSAEDIRNMLRCAKEYVTSNYFRIVGVVKTKVECHDTVGDRTRVDQLNEVCLRRLLFYLRIDDVIAL